MDVLLEKHIRGCVLDQHLGFSDLILLSSLLVSARLVWRLSVLHANGRLIYLRFQEIHVDAQGPIVEHFYCLVQVLARELHVNDHQDAVLVGEKLA